MVKNYNKEFNPELTPKQMLEYGVFGGSYLGNTIHKYPKSWFTKAKIRKTFGPRHIGGIKKNVQKIA